MKQWWWMMLCGLLAGSAAWAQQATSPRAAIYTCKDAQGNTLVSERPIPQCQDREQRMLNRDGSQRGVQRPPMSPTERAAFEDAERQRQLDAAARQDAIRRDRNLLFRYPNEAAHKKAREAALDDVHASITTSEKRVAELQKDRKTLQDEAEFYKGKTVPFKLRRQLEDNEVSTDAQKTLIQNQQSELARINQLYDAELARLKRLWGGAPIGSSDEPVAASRAASAAAATSAR